MAERFLGNSSSSVVIRRVLSVVYPQEARELFSASAGGTKMKELVKHHKLILACIASALCAAAALGTGQRRHFPLERLQAGRGDHTQIDAFRSADSEATPAQTTFVVTNTNDSGAGSLRQAILDANANAGADTINFNIP